MKKLVSIFIFCLLHIFCYGQNIQFHLFADNQSMQIIKAIVPIPTAFDNELGAYSFLQNTLNDLRKNGYLACGLDSINVDSIKINASIYLGKQYMWAKINVNQVPELMLNNVGYNKKQFQNQIVNQQQVAQLCDKLLHYAENNGYPFASVFLDSIVGNENELQANLKIDNSYLIKLDSIDVQGNVEISTAFLNRYLGIKQGDLYNESVVKNISLRLRELSFLQEEKPWRMSFGSTMSILTIYLKNKDANKADILVGLLPNNNTVGGKFLLTGDVKLALVNSLRAGESFSLNWQNLQYKSPRLLLEATYPYIFNTPFGVIGKFNYQKNDTSFLNINSEIGAQYLISANKFLKFYYNSNISNTIAVDKNYIITNRTLPVNLDLNTNAFGIEWQTVATDYKLNPRKGYSIDLNGNAGIRNIKKNTTIENLWDNVTQQNFSYLYNSIPLNSYKYSITLASNFYKAFSNRITTRFAQHSGIIYNPNLFRNELFQIGGYRLMRGFDEASLFVNQYYISTIEPRFLLNKNSYFFIFGDAGFIKSPYINSSAIKNAVGIGAGISLETKSGMFNFMYALGNNLGKTIQFKNSKIHFGYVNNF